MPTYTFPPAVVLVEETGSLAIGSKGVLRPSAGATPVAVYDLNGSPIADIPVGPLGVHPGFRADIANGVLDFGSVLLPVVSLESLSAALQAQAAADASAASAAAAQDSAAAAEATATGLTAGDAAATPGTLALRDEFGWTQFTGVAVTQDPTQPTHLANMNYVDGKTWPKTAIDGFDTEVMDVVAANVAAGNNITLTRNDLTGVITISSAGGGSAARGTKIVSGWNGTAYVDVDGLAITAARRTGDLVDTYVEFIGDADPNALGIMVNLDSWKDPNP